MDIFSNVKGLDIIEELFCYYLIKMEIDLITTSLEYCMIHLVYDLPIKFKIKYKILRFMNSLSLKIINNYIYFFFIEYIE